MTVKLKNNADGLLLTAITADAVSIALVSGGGDDFPTLGVGDYFYATLTSTAGTSEIIKVTARSSDNLTVVRAQESTTAAAFPANSRIELRVTAQSVLDAVTDGVAVANAYADTVVGGSNAATLDSQLPAYYLARANHTGTQDWSTLTGTPTTLAGYGIVDGGSGGGGGGATTLDEQLFSGDGVTADFVFTGMVITSKPNISIFVDCNIQTEADFSLANNGTDTTITFIGTVPPAGTNNIIMRGGVQVGSGSGTGDVVGPASVTDGRFALFNTTTGKLIKQHTGAPGALAVLDTVSTSLIDDDAVTFAKMQNATAAGFVGATGAGDFSERTPTQVTAALDAVVGDSGAGGTKGLVPAPATGDAAAGKFLKASGVWAIPSGGGGGGGDMIAANNLSDLASASTARTNLGLAIGTHVQAYDADLDTIAGLTATTDNFIQAKSSAWASRTPAQVTADLSAMVGDSGAGGTKGLVPAPAAGDTAAAKYLKADGTWAVPAGAGGLVAANNLSDLASAATGRFNLGLVIGAHVQAYDSDLTTWANITPAAGISTFLTTPNSANLLALMPDETGTGALCFATAPTLVTPVLGVATATSINKVAITAPATSATLTIANGKTLTASNTVTLTATDGSTLAIGAGGTLGTAAYTASTAYAAVASNLSDLASASTARTNLGLGTAAVVADSTLVHIAGTETITGSKAFSSLIQATGGVAVGTDTDLYIYESATNILTLRGGGSGTETYLSLKASGWVDAPGSLTVGTPTGGNLGTGKINANGVYDDNTLLTDLVLDYAVTNTFDAVKYANHPLQSQVASWWFDPDQYAEFWRSERRLPGMLTWDDPADRPSTGESITRLTAVVEMQAVLIEKLNARLKALEATP